MSAEPHETNDAQGDAQVASVREAARDSIFLAASVWFAPGGPRHETRVRNISAGGMAVDFSQARPVGSSIFAEVKGIGEVTGVVAWSTPKRLGIRFAQEIDPEAARYRPTAMPIPGARLPVFKDRRPGLALR